IRGCHPLWPCFPTCSSHSHCSADPRSLATTSGVSVDFLSSGYLDVSVPRVCFKTPMDSGFDTWFTLLLTTSRVSHQTGQRPARSGTLRSNNNRISGGLPHSEIHGSKLILSSP